MSPIIPAHRRYNRPLGETCPDCGLPAATGEPDCAALRDALTARVQHAADVKSAKSLAAHLCGLCVALEHDNNAATLKGIQQWLSANPKLQKPELPSFGGSVTIADVWGVALLDYERAVEAWARSAWEAYRDLQPLAREWLARSGAESVVRR